MSDTLLSKYGEDIKIMATKSRAAAKIDENSVYEEANLDLQEHMYKLMSDNLLPGSGLSGIENFKAFYEEVKNGKSGLILMEHYTNLDLPQIVYMLEKHGEDWSLDFSKRIVAIAGMKLNEADPAVRAFAECFSRVVIYPTRSLDAVAAKDISEEEKAEEEKRARKINFAAMRAMDACKKRGQIILVFPSGTRFRPDKPETKKGLREIDSYLRLFDKMILVSINGQCLHFNPECPENMIMDVVVQDKVTLTASPVIDCKEFRNNILASLPADEPDPKQKTIDAIMDKLEEQHNAYKD